jgi:hypothetical protein
MSEAVVGAVLGAILSVIALPFAVQRVRRWREARRRPRSYLETSELLVLGGDRDE